MFYWYKVVQAQILSCILCDKTIVSPTYLNTHAYVYEESKTGSAFYIFGILLESSVNCSYIKQTKILRKDKTLH